jgi:hypothetical protein
MIISHLALDWMLGEVLGKALQGSSTSRKNLIINHFSTAICRCCKINEPAVGNANQTGRAPMDQCATASHLVGIQAGYFSDNRMFQH